MQWKGESIGQQGRGQDRHAVVACRQTHVLLVADGAGGTGHGDLAADRTIEFVRAAVINDTGALDAGWSARMLERADAELAVNTSSGQTTAVLVAIHGATLWGASVGDSAAWLIGQTSWVDLTESQKRKPLVGSGRARATPFGPIYACGSLLVATDGLTKYASPSSITSVMRNKDLCLDSKVQNLLALPRMRAGTLHDDVTVVVCELNDAT